MDVITISSRVIFEAMMSQLCRFQSHCTTLLPPRHQGRCGSGMLSTSFFWRSLSVPLSIEQCIGCWSYSMLPVVMMVYLSVSPMFHLCLMYMLWFLLFIKVILLCITVDWKDSIFFIWCLLIINLCRCLI
jgi:hypothetical protein